VTIPKITNQGVAVYCITLTVATIFAAFYFSRGDHDIKLMSLQAVLTTGGTLLGIAGTLLVGVETYKRLAGGAAADLPPGSHVEESSSSTIVTPPPQQPAGPAQPK
jgi:hypothetical protein